MSRMVNGPCSACGAFLVVVETQHGLRLCDQNGDVHQCPSRASETAPAPVPAREHDHEFLMQHTHAVVRRDWGGIPPVETGYVVGWCFRGKLGANTNREVSDGRLRAQVAWLIEFADGHVPVEPECGLANPPKTRGGR